MPEPLKAIRLVPTPRLAALVAVAAVAAVWTAMARLMSWTHDLLDLILIWDGMVVAVAVLDASLGRQLPLTLERQVARVLSVGRPNPALIVLHNSGRQALRVTVQDDGAEAIEVQGLAVDTVAPSGSTVEIRYYLQPAKRGEHRLGDLWLRTPSRLGLWQRQVRVPAQQIVRVYPDVQQVRVWDLMVLQSRDSLSRATRQRGGETEFERLREYTQDDDVRHIDWRATARHRSIIAREFQLESNQNILFALDLGRLLSASSGGLSLLDHSLNATLMLAHVAARAGDQVGLMAFDREIRAFLMPEAGPRAVKRIIQASYDLQPTDDEPDYRTVLTQLRRRLRKRSLVVLFTQVADEETQKTLIPLIKALSPGHLPLCVMLRDPALEDLLSPRHRGAEALYAKGPAAAELQWRQRVVDDMRRAGALVLHVKPQELTAELISRYLEVKRRQWL